jgi:phosphoglycolate phosphatase
LSLHLLFDLDGTLVDSFPAISISVDRTADDLGVPRPAAADLRALVGSPLNKVFEQLLGRGREDLIEPAIARYRLHFEEVGRARIRLFPGIDEALRAWSASGLCMQIVTARAAPSADGILSQFNLASYFACVHAPAPATRDYDKADHVKAALDRAGIGAARALFVGDRADDMRAARAHQVPAIGVLWGNGTREELEAAGAVHVVAEASELVAWIAAHPVVASTGG